MSDFYYDSSALNNMILTTVKKKKKKNTCSMDIIPRCIVKASPPQKTSQTTIMMYQEPDSHSPDKLDQVSFEENHLLTIKAL